MSFNPSTAANAVLLAIDHTKIDADLTDFPLAIDLAVHAPDIFSDLGADKLKLAVCSSDAATQYYTEIEHWDNANGKGVLHVKIPSISASVDTQVKIVWDSTQDDNTTYVGETNTTPAENVWDSNFVAVYHMAQDPSGAAPQILDSTSNHHHGTSHGSMTSADLVDGAMGKAIDFDGGNDYIDLGNVYDWNSSDFTLDLSCNYRSADDSLHIFFDNASDGNYNNRFYSYTSGGTGGLNTYARVTSSIKVDGGVDFRESDLIISYQRGPSNIYTWVNGAVHTTLVFSGDCSQGHSLTIGGSDWGHATEILIFGFRVSSIARSDAWIAATNASLKDDLLSSILYTVSGTVAENGTPVARKLYLFDRATGVKVAAATSDATTGSYLFAVPDTTTKYFVVALDDDAGTEYNALIADRVTGVLV